MIKLFNRFLNFSYVFFSRAITVAAIVFALPIQAGATSEPRITDALNNTFVGDLVDKHIEEKASAMKVINIDSAPATEELQNTQVDSLRRRVVEYYYDQFRHSLDPDMPYFLFMSKGADVTLGVGGGVRMRAYYDWDGAMPTNAFMPSQIPIPADPAAKRKFGSTASGSYVNMIMIGRHKKIGEYGLYIEGEFTGYQGIGFKLNKSYARVRDWTFGLARSTFADPAAQPAIVDAAGPNNKFDGANVLVRWMPRISSKWLAAVSVETPNTAIDETGPEVRAVTNWLPDAAAFIEYEWKRGQHVRLCGIIRSLSYLSVQDSKQHNLAGWALQLSAVGRPCPQLTLYSTLNGGRGYAGLGGDLISGAYDLVTSPSDASRLYAPFMTGWSGAIQWNFRPNLFASVTASQTLYSPKKGTDPNEYKRGTFLAANVFWSIIPRLTVAAECDWGQRRNISGEHKAAFRTNLTAMFTF